MTLDDQAQTSVGGKWPRRFFVAALKRSIIGYPFAKWLWPRLVTIHGRSLLVFGNLLGLKITVVNRHNHGSMTAIGDTLLVNMVCKSIKQKYRRIKINVLTKNPEIISNSPWIDSFNESNGSLLMRIVFTYSFEGVQHEKNVVGEFYHRFNIPFSYESEVHLSKNEIAAAKHLWLCGEKPVIAINTTSVQNSKNWPVENWNWVIQRLKERCLIIQLGGKEEVIVDGTTPLAGRLGLRESMACLASAKVFVGPDSFLMHAARGLQIPSIIILGGRLKPEHIGYSQNRNLYVAEDCGPCGLLGPCGHGVKCMDKIKPQLVLRCIEQALGTP